MGLQQLQPTAVLFTSLSASPHFIVLPLFSLIQRKKVADGPTDGQTRPLIEMRGCIKTRILNMPLTSPLSHLWFAGSKNFQLKALVGL